MRAPSFWYPASRFERLLGFLLSPLGLLYDLGGRLKQLLARPFDPDIPVVCVGNLTAGGTGKTPLAIAIAKQLAQRGRKPFLLTRGYGGKLKGPLVVNPARHTAEMVGDEPLLLARAAPTVVAHDRAAGARLAVSQGAGALVMDDGFQNFALRKTLSVLVVDAELGFGNGHIIPAGPLRESIPRGLERAQALVLMGLQPSKKLLAEIADFAGPIFHAELQSVGRPAAGRYFAFAGIGRPEKLRATLATLGAEIAGERWFADHHPYTDAELAALKAEATRLGARLVTTEKDLARLGPRGEGIAALPVAAAIAERDRFETLLSSLT